MADRFVTLPFGHALKLRRDKLGLTQPTLAERVGETMDGTLDQSSVSRWEAKSNPIRNYNTLQALAKALDTSVDDLVAGRVPAEWVGIYGMEEAQGDELHQQLDARVGPLSEEELALIELYRQLYAEAQEHVQRQVRLLLMSNRQRNGNTNQDPPLHHDDTHRGVGGA